MLNTSHAVTMISPRHIVIKAPQVFTKRSSFGEVQRKQFASHQLPKERSQKIEVDLCLDVFLTLTPKGNGQVQNGTSTLQVHPKSLSCVASPQFHLIHEEEGLAVGTDRIQHRFVLGTYHG